MLPLVFLPGTLCDERLWRNQTGEFPNSFVVNLRTQNTTEEMLESVRAVPYEKFILVGFSMGGYIAQEFALKYPERVHHLVVIGSSALGYPEKERAIVQKSLPMIKPGVFTGITERRLKDYLHPKSYADAELRDLIQSMAGTDAAEVYLRQLRATLDRRDLSQQIRSLACPLTVIGGKQDQIVSAESVLKFETFRPGTEVYLVNECGHFSPLEKPDDVNRVICGIL